MTMNALVPELAVRDAAQSLGFYCGILGFSAVYSRPEEGFAFLTLGEAQLMIDQTGLGRTLAAEDAPLGRGMNLQIRIDALAPLCAAVEGAGVPYRLPPEERWYRREDVELGQRQFVVPDPDGYLLRFFEEIGTRPAE
jgi:catechol 2,3-dioxygenase-like lactoylglutathione lyase family enzyme